MAKGRSSMPKGTTKLTRRTASLPKVKGVRAAMSGKAGVNPKPSFQKTKGLTPAHPPVANPHLSDEMGTSGPVFGSRPSLPSIGKTKNRKNLY